MFQNLRDRAPTGVEGEQDPRMEWGGGTPHPQPPLQEWRGGWKEKNASGSLTPLAPLSAGREEGIFGAAADGAWARPEKDGDGGIGSITNTTRITITKRRGGVFEAEGGSVGRRATRAGFPYRRGIPRILALALVWALTGLAPAAEPAASAAGAAPPSYPMVMPAPQARPAEPGLRSPPASQASAAGTEPGRDDGSIWVASNEWSPEWEDNYSKWVSESIDPDFFRRMGMWTDCADVPYLVRWIFARKNALPQGAHDIFDNVLGNWSKDLAHLPRHSDWQKDKRFWESMIRLNEMTLVRSFPHDTYPIAVMPDAGFLRPGTVVADEHHSRVVTQIDRHSFFPIVTSASTLPPEIRSLTVEVLNRDVTFEKENGYGLVNFNWWRFDKARAKGTIVPDEKMPGHSFEEYDLFNKLEHEDISDYLQKQYAFKIDDPKQALQELLADLRNAVLTRQEVVEYARAFYQKNPGAKGDKKTEAYDFFSTGQRDARIRSKIRNIRELVGRKYLKAGELEEALRKETFHLGSGEEINFLELANAVDRESLSPEPWDPPLKRWGQGGWRLLWERKVGMDVDGGLQISPSGVIVASSSGGAAVGLSENGEIAWRQALGGSDSPKPAMDEKGVFYFCGSSGGLTALDSDGHPVWTQRASGTEFTTPGVGRAEGWIYTASNRGVVQAFDTANGGRQVWMVELKTPLLGPAVAEAGPLVVAATKGSLIGLNRANGQTLWEAPLGSKVHASPVAGPDGRSYVGGSDGNVRCFSAEGKPAWKVDVGDSVTFAPTLGSDGSLYVVAGSSVVRIDANGRKLWSTSVGDAIYSHPAVGPDGRAYVGSIDYRLHCLSPGGEALWSFPVAGSIVSSPCLAPDGRIFVGGMDKTVYALKERS